ncbi:MAG: hypothetical protein ACI4KI_04875 [Candidatus Fimenecus sp.]
MKKVISIILSVIIILLISVPCFASTSSDSQYSYIDQDGNILYYYLDNNNMPYIIENNERIFITLPLQHLKITSNEDIQELNAQIQSNSFTRAVPTNTTDLTQGDSNKSNVYTANVSFANFQTFTTPVFKLNTNHHAMRLKTTNVKKPLFGSSKVSFVYKYYCKTDDTWYQIIVNDVTCTGINGYGFQHDASSFPYGQFVLLIPDDVTSYTANIWTTLAY